MDANQAARFLENVGDELNKCVKCGACQSVCPIYLQTKREQYVARGKIALSQAVAQGRLPYTHEYGQVLHNCLLCLSCVQVCSSNVRVDRIVTAARASVARERGLPWPKRVAFKTLRSGQRMRKLLFQGGSLAQAVLFHHLPRSSGLRRRLPLPGLEKDQIVPPLTWKPFRSQHPEFVPAQDQTKTLVFFTGCASNYMYPRISQALLWLLNHLGYSLHIPKDQMCCGAPAESHGDQATVREVGRRNLRALAAYDKEAPVIVPCSSGGYMFKHIYPEMFSQGEDGELAAGLAARTFDISQFLVHEVGLATLEAKIETRCCKPTTYHDPCHLKRGQGVSREPRQLLHLVCTDFREMPEADRCCGQGGTYGLTHREMAKAVARPKMEAIQASGAIQVATGCPACIMQLQDGLYGCGQQATVRHTIEIVALALGWKTD